MTRPDATSPIAVLICVRDSLLAFQDTLFELQEAFPEVVETYELLPWDESSRKYFAQLRFNEEKQRQRFLGTLAQRPYLARLADLPYYCVSIADLDESDRLADFTPATEFLRHALLSVLNPEYKKQLLAAYILPVESPLEFLEALAVQDVEDSFTGIKVPVTRDFAEIILPDSVNPDEKERALENLQKLFLLEIAAKGRLRFAQDSWNTTSSDRQLWAHLKITSNDSYSDYLIPTSLPNGSRVASLLSASRKSAVYLGWIT